MLYDPPVPEFSVLRVQIDSGVVEPHPALDGPSIAIVTEGSGTVGWGDDQQSLDVSKGSVFFVAAGSELKMKANEKGADSLTIFRAFVEARP
jgi:mannose-6-phosphate isomerase